MTITMPKKCTIDGCSKYVLAKGICSAHYWRLKKYGSYDTPPLARSIEERFFSRIFKGSGGECWEWIGRKTPQGYGLFRYPKGQLAHRYSYLLHKGDVPEYKNKSIKLVIMHSCDNPSCVNPDHLSIGTQKQNTLDAFNKGRIIPARKGGKRLFDAKTAISIYLASGKYKDIGIEYGCSEAVVAGIKSGRSWKNITSGYALC